jgi:hypothetical protein
MLPPFRVGPPARLVLLLTMLVGIAVAVPAPAAAADPDYRVESFDLAPQPWAWRVFNGLPALRVRTRGPHDADGVPLFRWTDGLLYYRPGQVAGNGMRHLDLYRRQGSSAHLAQARRNARVLLRLARHARHAWWLPTWFDYKAEGLRAPWYDSHAQGWALSFFVRMYRVTGRRIYRQAADRVFASFLRLRRSQSPWVSDVVHGYLWLEHYPNGVSRRVLNAHLHAIFGLFEYWELTRALRARRVLEGAITTMRRNVSRYRRPGLASRYALSSNHGIVKYHGIHIWQLRLLARISGASYFARVADRFEHDLNPPGPGRFAPGPLR